MIGSIIGGVANAVVGAKNAERNIKYQKDFAQKGIQWRVADAKAAGIHPLAALGAQTTSFAPVQAGGGMSAMGQNIDRAIAANSTANQNKNALTTRLANAQITNQELQNEKLKIEMQQMVRPGTGPGIPTDGGTVPGSYAIKPNEIGTAMGNSPHTSPGISPERRFFKTKTGWSHAQSSQYKEANEEDTLGTLAWNLRNRVIPSLIPNYDPPPWKPKAGHHWFYNGFKQEWQERRNNRKAR